MTVFLDGCAKNENIINLRPRSICLPGDSNSWTCLLVNDTSLMIPLLSTTEMCHNLTL